MPRPTIGVSKSDKKVGEVIKAARKAKDLTQDQVAKAVHRERSFIGMIERGVRRTPLTLTWELADLLGIPAEDLLPEGMITSEEAEALEVLRSIPPRHRGRAVSALRLVAQMTAEDPPGDQE